MKNGRNRSIDTRSEIHSNIDLEVWDEHSANNRLQSLALLLFMAALMAALGWLFLGPDSVILLAVAGGVLALLNPATSPAWIMALYGARRVPSAQAPTLYGALIELSRRAGLKTVPTLYYIPSRMINAFAVGHKSNSAIGVTDGLLRNLDFREQIGVLAHEISHIRNGDMTVMGLADLFSRITSVLASLGKILLIINLPLLLMSKATISWPAIALLILAPTISALAQLGLSRTREHHADLNAVRLTGDPEGLARALTKIEQVQGAWLERLLLPGRQLPEPSLLRTHPPLAERVERLRSLKPAADRRLTSQQGLHETGATAEILHTLERLGMRAATPKPRWHITGLWH